MKCRKCGVEYGLKETYEGSVSDRRGEMWFYREPNSKKCKRCGTDLRAKIQVNGGNYATTSKDFIPYWSKEEITTDLEYALSQPKTIIIIAKVKEQIIGFTWGYQFPFEKFPFLQGKVQKASYVDEIAVINNKRRLGIGTLLCKKYEKNAKQQGLLEIVLRTDERNKASIPLFKKQGYGEILDDNSPRKKVYDPVFPNSIYLKKELGE